MRAGTRFQQLKQSILKNPISSEVRLAREDPYRMTPDAELRTDRVFTHDRFSAEVPNRERRLPGKTFSSAESLQAKQELSEIRDTPGADVEGGNEQSGMAHKHTALILDLAAKKAEMLSGFRTQEHTLEHKPEGDSAAYTIPWTTAKENYYAVDGSSAVESPVNNIFVYEATSDEDTMCDMQRSGSARTSTMRSQEILTAAAEEPTEQGGSESESHPASGVSFFAWLQFWKDLPRKMTPRSELPLRGDGSSERSCVSYEASGTKRGPDSPAKDREHHQTPSCEAIMSPSCSFITCPQVDTQPQTWDQIRPGPEDHQRPRWNRNVLIFFYPTYLISPCICRYTRCLVREKQVKEWPWYRLILGIMVVIGLLVPGQTVS